MRDGGGERQQEKQYEHSMTKFSYKLLSVCVHNDGKSEKIWIDKMYSSNIIYLSALFHVY